MSRAQVDPTLTTSVPTTPKPEHTHPVSHISKPPSFSPKCDAQRTLKASKQVQGSKSMQKTPPCYLRNSTFSSCICAQEKTGTTSSTIALCPPPPPHPKPHKNALKMREPYKKL